MNHTSRLTTIAAGLTLVIFLFSTIKVRAQESDSLQPLDGSMPISYFIADGTGTPGYRATDRELARWALEAWQRSAPNGLRFVAAPESKAIVRLYWAGPDSGEYGEMRPLMVAGHRGAAVFIRPDMESLGKRISQQANGDDLLRDSIVYLTCLHELGHAIGLEHTSDFRDIMYFFGYGGDVVEFFERYRRQIHDRTDIAVASGLSVADVKRVRMLYSQTHSTN